MAYFEFWSLTPEFQVPTKGIQQILVWGYNNTAAQRQARPGVICDTPRYGRFLLPPSPRIEIAQHVRAIIPFSFSFPLSPPGADRGAFSQRLWPPFRISCNEGLLKNMVGKCRNRQRRDWDYFTRGKQRTRTLLCLMSLFSNYIRTRCQGYFLRWGMKGACTRTQQHGGRSFDARANQSFFPQFCAIFAAR